MINFLKECKVFYVLTSNNNKPNGRPFGAISLKDNNLLIATNKNKNVYKEIINNPKIMLIALKSGTRSWIRIEAEANITDDLDDKKLLFLENPILNDRYNTVNDVNLAVFKLDVKNVEKY